MKNVLYESDYSPDTKLRIVTSPDNDVILKITGTGEMRIATSGGKLHGKRLVDVIKKFNEIIDILSDENYGEETEARIDPSIEDRYWNDQARDDGNVGKKYEYKRRKKVEEVIKKANKMQDMLQELREVIEKIRIG